MAQGPPATLIPIPFPSHPSRHTVPVLNVHERRFRATPEQVGALLDRLSTKDDPLWPHGAWPRMRFDAGKLAVGAKGGHGPVRYTVEHYDPGENVVFRFTGPKGFHGTHGLTVIPHADGTTTLKHTIVLKPKGRARLTWPLVIEPLHDALLEDALDNAERALHGSVESPARWSPRVKMLRRLLAPKAKDGDAELRTTQSH